MTLIRCQGHSTACRVMFSTKRRNMYHVLFSLTVDCPHSEEGGYELACELIVPIPPYIGMEIYHSGTDMTVAYLSIEYDQINKPKIVCVLNEIEDAHIEFVKHLYLNGWHLNPDHYHADDIKRIGQTL